MEQTVLEQVVHAERRQIGYAHPRLDEAVPVVAHYFLELERPGFGEVEIPHLLEERTFVGRHNGQDAGDALATESEVHGRTPYLRRSASIVCRLLKFSGTMSTPSMETPKLLSRAATSVTTSKESSIPSAMKSLLGVKSNSGRISFKISATDFIDAPSRSQGRSQPGRRACNHNAGTF